MPDSSEASKREKARRGDINADTKGHSGDREGYRGGGWILLDFGCVIVHIFQQDMREFYNLEHLWSDAEEISLSALPGPTA